MPTEGRGPGGKLGPPPCAHGSWGASAPPRPAPDPEPDEPEGGAPTGPPACDLCGAPMLDRHCKLVCTGCGYQRDCSDP